MSDTPLPMESSWQRWSSVALSPGTPIVQRAHMRTAYMSGMAAAIGLVLQNKNSPEFVERLTDELQRVILQLSGGGERM